MDKLKNVDALGGDIEILQDNLTNMTKLKRGPDIFYYCMKCRSAICSVPENSVRCNCGSIGIDKEKRRLYIDEYNSVMVVKL